MAISISNEDRTVMGDRVVVFATVTIGTYATGGVAIAASDFSGLNQIDFIQCSAPSIDDQAINSVVYVRSTGKLMVIDAAGAQEGNATNLGSTTMDIMVFGKQFSPRGTVEKKGPPITGGSFICYNRVDDWSYHAQSRD